VVREHSETPELSWKKIKRRGDGEGEEREKLTLKRRTGRSIQKTRKGEKREGRKRSRKKVGGPVENELAKSGFLEKFIGRGIGGKKGKKGRLQKRKEEGKKKNQEPREEGAIFG